MTLLALGVALFAVCHLTLALPEAKAALRRRLGKFFGPGFGIVSLLPLVLIVLGWRSSPLDIVYDTPSWGRMATFILVALRLRGQQPSRIRPGRPDAGREATSPQGQLSQISPRWLVSFTSRTDAPPSG